MMKFNDIHCFLKTAASFSVAKSEVVISPIDSDSGLSIALVILAEDDEQHTIYFPHSSIPELVQRLSSAYFSITNIDSTEEDDDAKQ